MAYRQYTSCVSPGAFIDLGFNLVGYSQILLLLIVNGAAAFFLQSLLGGPAGIWAGIAAASFFVMYFTWWLHGRLICLGPDQCLIGVITSLGPSNPLDKGGDNDFTMNLLLAPGPTNFSFPNADYWNSAPQGYIPAPNSQILGIGRGYISDDDHKPYEVGIHCEFEGDGIFTLWLESMAILAALILALIFPQAAAILIILAIFLFLAGLLGKWLLPPPGAPGAGNPIDVDPSLGTLSKGDVVVVKGDWVYDSLHPGWNEIHAVHDCQIIGHMDLPDNLNDGTIRQTPWLPGLGDFIDLEGILAIWCQGIIEAGTIEAAGSRNDPQNQWVIHPVVDGCNPVVIV